MPIVGRETVVGLTQGSVWGTPVTLGVGDGLLIRTWGVKPTREFNEDDSLGQDFISGQDKGKQSAAGSPTAYLRYRGLETFIALLMGNASVTAELTASQGDYRHDLKMTSSTLGKFATIAANLKSDKRHEVPSAKVMGITITSETGNPVEIAFDILGDDVVTGSANVKATVSIPDTGNRVISDTNHSLRINAQSGVALAGGDAVKASKCVLTIKRSPEGDWVKGTVGMDEPDGGGHPEITLAVTLTRYDNSVWYDAWTAQTAQKGRWKFTGAQLGTGELRTFEMWFPKMELIEGEPDFTGPGKIPQELVFKLFSVSVAPTGFTSSETELPSNVIEPVRVQILNDNSTVAMT